MRVVFIFMTVVVEVEKEEVESAGKVKVLGD